MTLVWIVSYDTDLKTSVRLRSLGRIRIRIYDPRLHRSWCTKGTGLCFVRSVTMTVSAKYRRARVSRMQEVAITNKQVNNQ